MIIRTYDEWKDCIVNDCKIKLTQDFAQQRLIVYQDRANPETRKFILLYGEQHLQNIINWLTKILKQ